MSNAHNRKKKSGPKLIVRLGGVNDIRLGTPAHPPTFLPLAAAPVEKRGPSITDYIFEKYQAANLNDDQKHTLVGKLRNELPIVYRDEVDDVLLRSMGQQLELAVFPTCKMMQVDPAAVKRMLDDQFRKAYGAEAEAEVLKKLGMCRLEDVERAVTAERLDMVTEKEGTEQIATESDETLVGEEQDPVSTALPPPTKKAKREPPNNTMQEIKAHVAKRKRGKRGVRIVTLRSKGASQKWEALSRGF